MELINKKVYNCKKCNLYKTRNLPVIGDGGSNPIALIIGEAPGANEDKTGKPFVGNAGKFLKELLLTNKISKKDVYITNMLKCRPPRNRSPLQSELKSCSIYLKKQIILLQPNIILTLGCTAFNSFYKGNISSNRNKFFKYTDNIILFTTYHPAAIYYKNDNINLINAIKNDIKLLDKLINNFKHKKHAITT